MSLFQKKTFGEIVPGYSIPVLNEREIRAAAGLLFLPAIIAFMICNLRHEVVMIKYVVVVFFVDLGIRTFFNPRYAPSLIIGRFIVRKQVPEYVGAKQKRFAWAIGFVLASVLLGVQVIGNQVSPVTGLGCNLCLLFLFFESAFGICLGCRVYNWIYKEKAEHCPGEVCEPHQRHAIQKIGQKEIIAFILVLLSIGVVFYLFGPYFQLPPEDPFGVFSR